MQLLRQNILTQGLFPQLIMRVSGVQQVLMIIIKFLIFVIDYLILPFLDEPGLSTLLRELIKKVDSKWENLGILLEIESHRLESIKTEEHHNTQNCLREMLKTWLKMINPPPSWSAITNALECIGDEQLARNLRSKYLH